MTRPPDPATLERPWLQAYPPGVPASFPLPPVALPRLLEDAARDFPAGPAVVGDGVEVDHASLAERVRAVAGVLRGVGVRAGQRVLVAEPNGQLLPVVLLALWRVGAIAVPVDAQDDAARLRVVVTAAAPLAAVGRLRALERLEEVGALPEVALATTGEEWPQERLRLSRLRRLAPRRRRAERLLLSELLADGDSRLLPVPPGPADAALLVFPADSPQHFVDGPHRASNPADAPDAGAVVWTHANLVAAAFQSRLWVPDIQAGRERVLVAEPALEPAALVLGLLTGLLSAACLVLVDDPDPVRLARTIERERPTLFPTTATRLAALLSEPAATRRDLGSLRVCMVTGPPPDPALVAAVEQVSDGARVRAAYGPAQAAPLTHAQPVYGRVAPEQSTPAGMADTFGLPVTGTVAAVVDPDDLSALRPPGEMGLLAVHGPQVATGRWPLRGGPVWRDGWAVTDELVTVDEQGVFARIGRVGEVVDRDGTPVSPERVRTIIERHPEVRRARIVLGEAGLDAEVLPRRRARLDVAELHEHAARRLAPAAVPDRITIVEELPEGA